MTIGSVVTDDAARLCEEVALRIVLVVGDHRAVEAGVDAVDVAVRADRREEAVRERRGRRRRQSCRPTRTPTRRSPGSPSTPAASKTVERTADLRLVSAVRREERLADRDVEIVGAARDRVEGRHLLDACEDEDPIDRPPSAELLLPAKGRLVAEQAAGVVDGEEGLAALDRPPQRDRRKDLGHEVGARAAP